MEMSTDKNGNPVVIIYTPFITKGKKRCYKKDGGKYRLEIPLSKYKPR